MERHTSPMLSDSILNNFCSTGVQLLLADGTRVPGDFDLGCTGRIFAFISKADTYPVVTQLKTLHPPFQAPAD